MLGGRRVVSRVNTFPFLKLFRFGVVGLIGFVVDTAVVYALAPFSNLFVAGIVAYPVAATFNWVINRVWTYGDRDHTLISLHRQWTLFLVANSIGFVLNRGTYVFLIANVPICAAHPVIAVAAGAVAGLFSNFVLSHRVVFR